MFRHISECLPSRPAPRGPFASDDDLRKAMQADVARSQILRSGHHSLDRKICDVMRDGRWRTRDDIATAVGGVRREEVGRSIMRLLSSGALVSDSAGSVTIYRSP